MSAIQYFPFPATINSIKRHPGSRLCSSGQQRKKQKLANEENRAVVWGGFFKPFHSFFAIFFPRAEPDPGLLKQKPKVDACISLFAPLN